MGIAPHPEPGVIGESMRAEVVRLKLHFRTKAQRGGRNLVVPVLTGRFSLDEVSQPHLSVTRSSDVPVIQRDQLLVHRGPRCERGREVWTKLHIKRDNAITIMEERKC